MLTVWSQKFKGMRQNLLYSGSQILKPGERQSLELLETVRTMLERSDRMQQRSDVLIERLFQKLAKR